MALTPIVDSFTNADFDTRWAAWRRNGAAEDRITQRRLRMVFPLLIIAGAACYYLLLPR